MDTTLTAGIFAVCLFAAVLIGMRVRRLLPDHHLTADSRDAVKLAMGLVATMTALLLGLLVSSAKGSYDAQRDEVIQMAAKVALLDRLLVAYGPEATEAHVRFRDAAELAYRRLWPEGRKGSDGFGPVGLGADRVYSSIQELAPQDETRRGLKAQATTLAMELGELRMLLMAQMAPSVPKPLLVAVGCWLVIIFLGFSLLAPPNATTRFALLAAAASVVVAVYMIMELDQPFGGAIRISGEPMRNALLLLGK